MKPNSIQQVDERIMDNHLIIVDDGKNVLQDTRETDLAKPYPAVAGETSDVVGQEDQNVTKNKRTKKKKKASTQSHEEPTGIEQTGNVTSSGLLLQNTSLSEQEGRFHVQHSHHTSNTEHDDMETASSVNIQNMPVQIPNETPYQIQNRGQNVQQAPSDANILESGLGRETIISNIPTPTTNAAKESDENNCICVDDHEENRQRDSLFGDKPCETKPDGGDIQGQNLERNKRRNRKKNKGKKDADNNSGEKEEVKETVDNSRTEDATEVNTNPQEREACSEISKQERSFSQSTNRTDSDTNDKKFAEAPKTLNWHVCFYCQKEGYGTRLCGRCGLVRYCSKDCQLADYKRHKLPCRHVSRFYTARSRSKINSQRRKDIVRKPGYKDIISFFLGSIPDRIRYEVLGGLRQGVMLEIVELVDDPVQWKVKVRDIENKTSEILFNTFTNCPKFGIRAYHAEGAYLATYLKPGNFILFLDIYLRFYEHKAAQLIVEDLHHVEFIDMHV